MARAKEIYDRILNQGEDAINHFIETRKSEELFLDFKRSADNGNGNRLNRNDRNNLAKCISGFGTSEGGVIVWGVDCSDDDNNADVAHTKYPIKDPKRFVSWLEGVVSSCTIPPHTEVENYAIISGDNKGFVITYIPKSNRAPHQVVGKYRYYIRSGSSFSPTPHQVLAGMFGRRPQPKVYNMFTTNNAEYRNGKISIKLGFLIRNDGPGIARDLFMNAMVISNPGENSDINFQPTDSNEWTGKFSFGRQISMICEPDFRLPPETWAQPFTTYFTFAPPFDNKLEIECLCGAAKSPAFNFRIYNEASTIENIYNEFVKKHEDNNLTDKDKKDVVNEILKIDS